MVAVRRKTIEEIIAEVQRVAALIGRPPTGNDWAQHKAWGFTEAVSLRRQGYPWPKLLVMAGFEVTEQQAKLGRRAISPEQVEGARIAMLALCDENGFVPHRRWKENHGGHPGTFALMSYHNTRDWLVVLERMGFYAPPRKVNSKVTAKVEKFRDINDFITKRKAQPVTIQEERDTSQTMAGYVNRVEVITRQQGNHLVRIERTYIQLR